ncbi:DUF2062 domain-containing protein [Sulfurimonas paralvinellae]|uniref:DUF2062 domain-containing protein n=1 Tax=Sulfurimonas paralvinellae TaxID=317658 RepID=A0A7M1B8N6_9BACT|nr:DUF2062 domain-containing protein [Sulfurimonas paralvinellae]QOP46103.1 DUF2062 domain-containing protein [Sulfurimonas paralvinellae]
MIRKTLKKTSSHKKLRDFIKKYKIPPEYLSTSRKMISRGVLIGLFIAFIPMPMQMAAVLLFVPFVRFNVPIALAMCWLSNPITMPPMYYMEYLTGSFLLGIQPEPVQMTLEWFKDNMGNIFIPLYFGTAMYSIFGSLAAYFLVNYLWKLSVHRDRKLNRKDR